MAIGTEGLGRRRARGGPAAPAASQDREEPDLGERSTRRDRDHPDRPTVSWARVGRGVPVCEGARFHGVHIKKSLLASRALVVWIGIGRKVIGARACERVSGRSPSEKTLTPRCCAALVLPGNRCVS